MGKSDMEESDMGHDKAGLTGQSHFAARPSPFAWRAEGEGIDHCHEAPAGRSP